MKKLRLLLILLVSLTVILLFSSCEDNPKETDDKIKIAEGYFNSKISVVSKDGKISFELEDENIVFTSPQMINGAVLTFKDGKASLNLKGFDITVPQSFIKPFSEFKALADKFATGDTSTAFFENDVICIDKYKIKAENDGLSVIIDNNEFFVKKKDDQKNGKNNRTDKS